MDLKDVANQYLGRLDPRLMSGVFRYLKKSCPSCFLKMWIF